MKNQLLKNISKTERECKVCREVKDNAEFDYKLGYVCRKCNNERSKRYNQAHRVEILAKKKLLRLKWKAERDAQPKIFLQEISLPKRFMPKCYPEYNKPTFVDEEYMEMEPTYCQKFGCGKELNLVEKLAGNLCLKHQVYIRNIF